MSNFHKDKKCFQVLETTSNSPKIKFKSVSSMELP